MRRFLLVAFLLGACSNTPTQVIVEIDADEDIRESVEEIRLEVYAQDEAGELTDRVFLGSRGVTGWPMRHVVTPQDGDAQRRYLVVATGLDGTAMFVSATRLRSGYLDGEVGLIRLVLPGGACVGVSCPSDETCLTINEGARCVAIPEVDPVVEGGDPLRPDANLDVGIGDAGPDAPPTCEAGVTCELPEPGGCVEGVVECDEAGVASCVARARPMGDVCRPADPMNPCDVDDVCDGESFSCPTIFADNGMMCDGGGGAEATFCFDGACRACIQDEPCRPDDNVCLIGRRECGGEAPTCVFVENAPNTTVCRAVPGDGSSPCDAPELCMDGVCPADGVRPAGDICRGADEPCDVPEMCDGETKGCPTDRFRPNSFVCAEACDTDACEGPFDTNEDNGVECGPEVDGVCQDTAQCMDGECRPVINEGVVCRPALDPECDQEERCDSNGFCPDDDYAVAGTSCGTVTDCARGECREGSCRDIFADVSTPCGGGDECSPGFCSGTGGCDVTVLPDGQACGDPDFNDCSGPDQCLGGACDASDVDPGEACLRNLGPCIVGACTTTGDCEEREVTDGTPCPGGVCGGGSCDPRVVIGEVAPPLTTAALRSSYIELYNPSSTELPLGGCVVMLERRMVAPQVIGLSTPVSIPGNSFFLIVGPPPVAPGFPTPDRLHTALLSLTPEQGSVTLTCNGTEIDALAWDRTGGEGDPAPGIDFGETHERKACEGSDAVSMAPFGANANDGNGYDTNNNAEDFVVSETRTIQNSSDSEMPGSMCSVTVFP